MSQGAGAFNPMPEAIFEVLSAAEADRVTTLYAPLAEAVREVESRTRAALSAPVV